MKGMRREPVARDRSEATAPGVEAHEPAGVVPAWDIRQTTYTVGADGVTAGAPKEVADNVLPAQLDEKYADLAGHTMFRGCG